METHTVKFQISLSNGETFFEGKGPFKEIPGEKSPWQKLIDYLVENKVEITSLALYTDEGRRFTLPHAGKNPKFAPQIKGDFVLPIDFHLFRYIEQDLKVTPTGEITDRRTAALFTVAEAIYPDYKIQLWVDEHDHNNCRVLIVEKGGDLNV